MFFLPESSIQSSPGFACRRWKLCDNDVKVEDTVKSKIKMTKAGENTSIIYIL